MLNSVRSIISNTIDVSCGQSFAAIIGENPSAGARSPKLWNAAFSALGLSVKMVPMDVTNSNLSCLLNALSKTPNFIGGAIAVPHKVSAALWLGDSITREARAIGAVNCLYRDKLGKIAGTNTDGEASRSALIDKLGSIEGKKILILGGGGTGRAVCAYMASDGATVILACRNNPPAPVEQQLLGIERLIPWSDIPTVLSEVNVVINCTTVGSGSQINQTPLCYKDLKLLRADCIVFDVIYDPSPTSLVMLAKQCGLDTLDGLSMNREQAVIAFNYAVSSSDQFSIDQIRLIMSAQ